MKKIKRHFWYSVPPNGSQEGVFFGVFWCVFLGAFKKWRFWLWAFFSRFPEIGVFSLAFFLRFWKLAFSTWAFFSRFSAIGVFFLAFSGLFFSCAFFNAFFWAVLISNSNFQKLAGVFGHFFGRLLIKKKKTIVWL